MRLAEIWNEKVCKSLPFISFCLNVFHHPYARTHVVGIIEHWNCFFRVEVSNRNEPERQSNNYIAAHEEKTS